MNPETDRRFYIDFSTIQLCYPKEVSKWVTDFGELEQYKDQKYTLKEINEIIAQLVVKSPYIENSMHIKIQVMGIGYHHTLNFKNYNYSQQKREENPRIKFLFG